MAGQRELDPANSGTSDAKSPTKPPGILLTPGTATTRRKRVSFNHDVKAGTIAQQTTTNALPEEGLGKSASLFSGKDSEGKQLRPKSRFTQVLENSRKGKKPQVASSEAREPRPEIAQETDIQGDAGDDLERDPDVTVDLNEPHSRSGKYWKSCFETYHADAKAEMEKLVKYKQLAKSYAKMKDSEAVDLNQKLKEEQEKVKLVEQRVSEMSRQVASCARDNGGACDDKMVEELSKQTALALEYREQVRELEALLMDNNDRESEDGTRRRRQTASPRTQRTILETQRELRKARIQVREAGKLRDEVNRLKSTLQATEQRSARLAAENKKLASDLSQRSSKILDLERQLDESRAEARQKDRELRRLGTEHGQLKDNAKTRFVEAEQVLQKKNDQITSLKAEIRALTVGTESRQVVETRKSRTNIDGVRRDSVPRELELPRLSSDAKSTQDGRYGDGSDAKALKDETLVSSRALRKKLEADFWKDSSSSVLSDRGNLQTTRQTTSRSSNRHSYPSKVTGATSLEDPLPTSTRNATAGPSMEDMGLRRKPSQRYTEKQKAPAVRPSSAGSDAGHIDLMHGNFARLGGPDTNASTAWTINTSRVALPENRRAAAIARLELKRAQRARAHSNVEGDKENMLA